MHIFGKSFFNLFFRIDLYNYTQILLHVIYIVYEDINMFANSQTTEIVE